MAALDFPDTPTVGQLYGSSGTVWRWDGARWASTAGASGARGRVAYAQTTVSQAGFTAPTTFNIAGLSVTYNAIAGRTYRIVAKISAQSNTANDLAQLVIALSDTGQQINGVNFALPAVNLAYGAVCEHVYTAASTSAQGIKLMYSGYVGGSSHTVYASAASPNFVSVEDITYEAGTSGGPPAYYKIAHYNPVLAASFGTTTTTQTILTQAMPAVGPGTLLDITMTVYCSTQVGNGPVYAGFLVNGVQKNPTLIMPDAQILASWSARAVGIPAPSGVPYNITMTGVKTSAGGNGTFVAPHTNLAIVSYEPV